MHLLLFSISLYACVRQVQTYPTVCPLKWFMATAVTAERSDPMDDFGLASDVEASPSKGAPIVKGVFMDVAPVQPVFDEDGKKTLARCFSSDPSVYWEKHKAFRPTSCGPTTHTYSFVGLKEPTILRTL